MKYDTARAASILKVLPSCVVQLTKRGVRHLMNWLRWRRVLRVSTRWLQAARYDRGGFRE